MYYNLFGSRVYIGSATWIFAIILVVLYLIAGAKILKKGGDSGWKILIPIYGNYCLYKVARSESIFWGTILLSVTTSLLSRLILSAQRTVGTILLIAVGIISLILAWKYASNMADAFGKGKGFALGLFLLSPIFMLILGFGSAEYQYGYSHSEQKTETVDDDF